MYIRDDQDSAKMGDRIIAAVVAGLLGYFLGGIFEFIAYKFLGNGYWLTWFAVIGFAGFGLFAPSRSRDLWSAFWTELLGLLSSRK